ncbi:dihydrofolate reductase family protein [Mucilaginibacter sp. KACC 22773]|uniref:RibD family protein n=1 Tax=Mucilaginibacter sp. KACC 22773 TaxID=3025671 RepID=UPI00236559CF|nr:dihydrofolate reductase family protein [Mucilaginibacter sp. KACC 22773]WDF77221.1 dihydrofolate reductase family protein [Mucilaginibacter sp. KACC 22773]
MKEIYIICHMMSTVDGRIISANWGSKNEWQDYSEVYNRIHESYNTQGWICGRVTMENDFSEGAVPELLKAPHDLVREPFIADREATSFAIAIDANGKLGWPGNELGGDHIISILTEKVSDEYLFYLQRKGISYLFGGKDEIDLAAALLQLSVHFGIKKLMLEGGGSINGAFLASGLIDELSLLLMPLADGAKDTATTFEVAPGFGKDQAVRMYLKELRRLDGDLIHLSYVFDKKDL